MRHGKQTAHLTTLMRQTACGNQSAFVKLFEATSPSVYGMAMAELADPALAEDVTSDIYLEPWRTARRFDGSRRDVSAWIEHIAIRHVTRRSCDTRRARE